MYGRTFRRSPIYRRYVDDPSLTAVAASIEGSASLAPDLTIIRALNVAVAGQGQLVTQLTSQAALAAVISGGGVLVATLTIQGEPVALIYDPNGSYYSYYY